MRRLSLWLCDIRLSVFCQPTGTVCHVVGINVVFYLLNFAFISSAVYSWLKYDGMKSDESAAGKTGRLYRFFPVQYYSNGTVPNLKGQSSEIRPPDFFII